MSLTHWYDQASGISQRFLIGLEYYYAGDYQLAADCFAQALHNKSNQSGGSGYELLYQGYLGLVQLMLGDLSAIELCRFAGHFERYEADVHYVLALAELRIGNRWHALNAIRSGLVIEPEHKRLLKLRVSLGQRRTPIFRGLSRDHFLNRLLGRLTWQMRRHA